MYIVLLYSLPTSARQHPLLYLPFHLPLLSPFIILPPFSLHATAHHCDNDATSLITFVSTDIMFPHCLVWLASCLLVVVTWKMAADFITVTTLQQLDESLIFLWSGHTSTAWPALELGTSLYTSLYKILESSNDYHIWRHDITNEHNVTTYSSCTRLGLKKWTKNNNETKSRLTRTSLFSLSLSHLTHLFPRWSVI